MRSEKQLVETAIQSISDFLHTLVHKYTTLFRDEDGMTPTLWAAFEGNLEALRLLVGRGYNCIQPQSDYEHEHDPQHHNDHDDCV